MNGNSKNGFGGAIEVSGPVDLTFINCEFGGSQSECSAAMLFSIRNCTAKCLRC